MPYRLPSPCGTSLWDVCPCQNFGKLLIETWITKCNTDFTLNLVEIVEGKSHG